VMLCDIMPSPLLDCSACVHRPTIPPTAVTLYDCNLFAGGCSSCVGTRVTPGIECGWCDSRSSQPSCRVNVVSECAAPPFYTAGQECPNHMITSFSPSSGPPSGGTVITISGRDLGVTFDDFSAPNSITVGGVSCTPLSMGYVSGATVLCQTGAGLPEGPQNLTITLMRNGVAVPVTASGFMVTMPTISSVAPSFGPIAGGSGLVVSGTGLDIGSTATVTLDGTSGPECDIR
jgi:plexin A